MNIIRSFKRTAISCKSAGGNGTNMIETITKQRAEGNKNQVTVMYSLRLYVAGQTPKSLTAIKNLNAICETHLAGRYTVEVIDLRVNPQLAVGDQILALPTLVRHLP